MSGPLITVEDFEAVTGVVEVRDCTPRAGHVTLLITPGLRDMVEDEIADRYPLNVTVHVRELEDRRVIACNHVGNSSAVRDGARCYLVLANPGGGHDRVEVLARSYGGRLIRRWVSAARVTNFRVVTLPYEHHLYDDDRILDVEPDAGAQLVERLRHAHEATA